MMPKSGCAVHNNYYAVKHSRIITARSGGLEALQPPQCQRASSPCSKLVNPHPLLYIRPIMTIPADQPQPAAAPAVPTQPVEVAKPAARPVPPPMKGWRNYPGNQNLKIKPNRSPATRFIQARRAPGK
jgi:hypothetical protein